MLNCYAICYRGQVLAHVAQDIVYLWTKQYTANWSSFSVDFEELDENQEYIEREDEFDLANEEAKGLIF
jgi:COMPASS component SWD1